jgi:hypothetical protein
MSELYSLRTQTTTNICMNGNNNDLISRLRARLPIGIVTFGAVGLMTACSTANQLTVTQPVGPAESAVAKVQGALQVYTATETHADGDNTYYCPHSPYLIYNSAGQKARSVLNHVGTMDETPSTVFLPPGAYTVVAEAEGYGRVRIPIVIQARRTTVLHLERGWKPQQGNSADLVRMPDGQPIGWRPQAQASKARDPEHKNM